MSLKTLISRALAKDEVKHEYDQLQSEFSLIDPLLSMRTQAGLTQEEVARRMHTQKSNISRLEQGNTNPRWSTLQKYAHACGFGLTLKPHKIN